MNLENVGTSSVKIVYSFRGMTNLLNEFEGRLNGKSPVMTELISITGPVQINYVPNATGVIFHADPLNTIPFRLGFTQPGGPGTPLVGGIRLSPNWPSFISLIPGNSSFMLSGDPPETPLLALRIVWL